MKKLLFLTLIYLVTSLNTLLEDKQGPAYNIKNKEAELSCEERYVRNDTEWIEESGADFVPLGISDCVDLQLYSKTKKKYYDHCCYVRFQLDGEMHAGCVGLSEENFLDIAATMTRMENGDREIWTRVGTGSKIYQLDCISSYLKNLSIASILLLALFF